MAEQRLPKVNQDDGTWGDILRQYLKKEHTDDGTDNAANGGHQHITITASDGTAGTAPIRLTSGPLLSVAAIGAIEFNNDTLYFTKTTGTTRMQVVMDTATQTLTNKTLTSPTISAPTFSGSYSFGGTPTWPIFNQSTTGSAATLTTSRTFQTNLASTSTASFNGSANVTPGVTGTLPVANGGTGATTFTSGYVLTGNATSPVTATKAAPSGAFVGTTDTQTLSSKRITPRTTAATVSASYTIDSDATDYYTVAGQNQNVTFNNPTGTPVDGQKLMVRIKDDGTPRLVGWGSNFQASGITGPLSQTVPNKEHNVLFVYSTGVSKWVCLASDSVGY